MKTIATRCMSHPKNKRQRSVNCFWSCTFGNRGIARIFEHKAGLLTALLGKNLIYQRKNTDSKIINTANCKTWKNTLWAVEYSISIIHYRHTVKARALSESLDGPAGCPADNPPNSDGLGDVNWAVPKSTVRVYWQPRPPISQWFGLDPDPDSKQWSGSVATTRHAPCLFPYCLFRQLTSCVWLLANGSTPYHPRYMTKHLWCSVDSDYQDGAGSVSISLLPTKAAKNSLMTVCNLSHPISPKIHDQQVLTLRWRTFSSWGWEGCSLPFAYKRSQYFNYV